MAKPKRQVSWLDERLRDHDFREGFIRCSVAMHLEEIAALWKRRGIPKDPIRSLKRHAKRYERERG